MWRDGEAALSREETIEAALLGALIREVSALEAWRLVDVALEARDWPSASIGEVRRGLNVGLADLIRPEGREVRDGEW